MNQINNVAMIGLGAIGCAYASKLYEMNPQGLRVIASQDRIKRYQQQGFVINGKRYDFTYVRPDEQGEPPDLIIIAVKAYQLAQAINDIRPFVGKHTIILSLLNGITSEELVGSEYGMERMLYSLCVAIDANRDGNNVHFSNFGRVIFGERQNREYSGKVQAVRDLFERADIPYEIPEDMMRALWWKFMINVGINQCSAVTRGRYGVFQTVDEAKKLMESTMWEVIRVAQKADIGLTGEDIQKWYDVLNTLGPENRTSMLEDIECGRKTEVDIFAGTICELGAKYGVDTPVNRTLFHIIKLIEG